MKLKSLLLVIPFALVSLFSSLLCANAADFIPEVDIFHKTAIFSRTPVIIKERMLVPGHDFMRMVGGTAEYDEEKLKISFKKGSRTIEMYLNEIIALKDGRRSLMEIAPRMIDKTPMVPLRALSRALDLGILWVPDDGGIVYVFDKNETDTYLSGQHMRYLASTGTANVLKNYRVVIDAGHGGSEPGAIVGDIKEKNLNLDISNRLESLLKEAGIRTYMTRRDDRYVGLYQRSRLANDVRADLFVSIHNNADGNGQKGSMTLYHPHITNHGQGGFNTYTAATNVQNELLKRLGTRDLGLIQRPHLAVLRTTNMPAILVEVGYMTNRSELRNLLNPNYRQSAAIAIRDGIIKTLKKGFKI